MNAEEIRKMAKEWEGNPETKEFWEKKENQLLDPKYKKALRDHESLSKQIEVIER